jgi:hypothetical protein
VLRPPALDRRSHWGAAAPKLPVECGLVRKMGAPVAHDCPLGYAHGLSRLRYRKAPKVPQLDYSGLTSLDGGKRF